MGDLGLTLGSLDSEVRALASTFQSFIVITLPVFKSCGKCCFSFAIVLICLCYAVIGLD